MPTFCQFCATYARVLPAMCVLPHITKLADKTSVGKRTDCQPTCAYLEHQAAPLLVQLPPFRLDLTMNYVERDTYGMYKIKTNEKVLSDWHKGPGPHLMGADTLLGNDVYNHNDEDLGDIKEIMLDMSTGRVSYAVLSFGGFLGVGEKLFAVPWAALTLDTVNKRFTLNVEKERLKSAPGFDKESWPNMADSTWAKGIHDYYGTKPYVHDSAV